MFPVKHHLRIKKTRFFLSETGFFLEVPYKSKCPLARAFGTTGGVDGARTRDPRRDRPVF